MTPDTPTFSDALEALTRLETALDLPVIIEKGGGQSLDGETVRALTEAIETVRRFWGAPVELNGTHDRAAEEREVLNRWGIICQRVAVHQVLSGPLQAPIAAFNEILDHEPPAHSD